LLKIRLSRTGSKKKPSYRVVVIEGSRARDGRFIDLLGHYNPKKSPSILKLDQEKYAYWVAKGAQPSATVRSFLKMAG
jgi:small subunit ribosomal protein S16